jgi:hypothetical protein
LNKMLQPFALVDVIHVSRSLRLGLSFEPQDISLKSVSWCKFQTSSQRGLLAAFTAAREDHEVGDHYSGLGGRGRPLVCSDRRMAIVSPGTAAIGDDYAAT